MTALLTALLSDVLPWLAFIGAALGGVWAYGRSQRARGAEEAERRVEQQVAAADRKMLEVQPTEANDVLKRLDEGSV